MVTPIRIVLAGVLTFAATAGAQESAFFHTSDQCIACHSGMVSDAGQDLSIGYTWRASMMANSARDPYWHAGVRREITDHPEHREAIEDTCSTCHMPMARFHSRNNGGRGEVFANLAAANPFALDGVSCTVCHQIQDGNFGDESSFTGGFLIDTTTAPGVREVYGPHDVDAGRQRVMQSAGEFLPVATNHLEESELCASCHTLITESLDDSGNQVGALAEQVPYLEWLHSDYRGTQSCQDCHMPIIPGDAPISSVLGQPRPEFSQHVFRGGNAFMLGILNKYRAELGVTALPQELEATAERTRQYLSTSAARLAIESAAVTGETLDLELAVASLSGHKLPTAYPSRRAWLHLEIRDRDGDVVFESGRLNPDGSIVGNDNDTDGARFEPHYTLIEREDQVQIYEPIIVDWRGRVTTGLLYGYEYTKDNRLLPNGFDKQTASWEVVVAGSAVDDPDFVAGGDKIRYRVPLGAAPGPLAVTVALRFQTIGYRWAENLRAYDAPEPQRFLRFYSETAGSSAVTLASATATVDY